MGVGGEVSSSKIHFGGEVEEEKSLLLFSLSFLPPSFPSFLPPMKTDFNIKTFCACGLFVISQPLLLAK